MSENTQNPAGEQQTLTSEAESEAAAIRALNGEPAPEEGQKDTKSDDDQTENSDATSDADDSESTLPSDDETDEAEEDADADLVEFESEGKTYKVPKALKEGNLRQSDYSRNMNALAEERKQVQAQKERAELMVSGVKEIAEAQRQAAQLQDELTQYENLDWAALQATNPGQYAKAVAHYTTLPVKIDQALLKAQNVEGDIHRAKQASQDEARNVMMETLQKSLKGWGDERGQKITAYALTSGYTANELQNLTDARVVIGLDKARRFDAIQAAKGELKAKVKGADPVAKPGAPRQTNKNADLMARFQKTHADEDAIRLLNG